MTTVLGSLAARRTQDADGSSSLNYNRKRKRRKNNFPSNDDLNGKEIFDDNVTNVDKQSVPSDVFGKVDIQEEAKTLDIGDQDNISAEITHTIGQNQPCYSIWALFDNLDGMPRYYAKIKGFVASNFKVHLTWLERIAMNEAEEKWSDEELPVACGSFSLGTIDISQDRLMFSHTVLWKANGGNMKYIPLRVRIEGFVSLFATVKEKSDIVVAPKRWLEWLAFIFLSIVVRGSGSSSSSAESRSICQLRRPVFGALTGICTGSSSSLGSPPMTVGGMIVVS
ncbi:putative J domain-containing protein C17A3.05c [Hordeum vulgare]|nr:putative J domain-containing protein C17A3.05c [Hordeum vulgare]